MRASKLLLHTPVGTLTFWRALTGSVDSCAEIKECPFSGVTSSGTDSVSRQLCRDKECPFSGVTSLGGDSIGGQLCGDQECPFSGVTNSGWVWRKVPENDAGSVVKKKRAELFIRGKVKSLL